MSDWSGGPANRTYRSGTTVVSEVPAGRLTEGVKAYLADCRRHAALLRASDHPTAKGVVKCVFHRTEGGEQFIRDEFERLAATRLEAVASA